MKQIFKLIKIELSNIYFLKQGKNLFLKDIITLVIFALFTTLNGAVYLKNMPDSALKEETPALFLGLVQIAVLYEIIVYLKGVMFSKYSHTVLCSMPIQQYKIIISKMACLIYSALRLELFLGLPFSVVCVVLLNMPIVGAISFLLVCISMAVLVCTAAVSIYSKRYFVAITAFGIVVVYAFSVINSTKSITDTVVSYPIASILLLIAIVVACCLCIYSIQRRYFEILTSIDSTVKKSHHTSRKNSVIAAICSKESSCFWYNRIWAINSLAFICVITIAFAVTCLFTDHVELLIKTQMANFPIQSMTPLILSCAIGMSCTTYCSFSMEGKLVELIQSMPIRITKLLLSKILFFVRLMVPFIVVNAVTMSICLKNGSMLVFASSTVLPVCFSIVIGCSGLLYDLYFGSFDWVSAINVVKQTIALPLIMLTTLVLNGLPIGMLFLFGIPDIAVYIFTLLLWSIVFFVEVRLIKKVARKKCIAN